MNDYKVEHLPDLNSLLVRIEGAIQIDSFPELYSQVIEHEFFQKDTNLIWNALSSSITNLKIGDLKRTFFHVKATESKRGNSCSAWVLPRGENYEIACLFKAAFASGLNIRYEIFSNLSEAKDWIRTIESRGIMGISVI